MVDVFKELAPLMEKYMSFRNSTPLQRAALTAACGTCCAMVCRQTPMQLFQAGDMLRDYLHAPDPENPPMAFMNLLTHICAEVMRQKNIVGEEEFEHLLGGVVFFLVALREDTALIYFVERIRLHQNKINLN